MTFTPALSIGDEIDLDMPPVHCHAPMRLVEVGDDGDHTFVCVEGDFQIRAYEDGIVADMKPIR